MQKPTMYVKSVESWEVKRKPDTDPRVPGDRVSKTVVAVRVRKGLPGAGQFHGATNFKTR